MRVFIIPGVFLQLVTRNLLVRRTLGSWMFLYRRRKRSVGASFHRDCRDQSHRSLFLSPHLHYHLPLLLCSQQVLIKLHSFL